MKKILVGFITLLTLISFSQSFAQSTPGNYQSKVISIQEALHKPFVTSGIGPSTMVDVINYSDYTIDVTNLSFPTFNRLTHQTAARIISDGWLDDVHLRLSDTATGRIFYEDYVPRLALISVYVVNGQYVVYKTPTYN